MDKNIHPLAAFLVVLIASAAIAIWFWCSGEAKEYGGPASLTIDPDGHLYIQVRNQLLEHDERGAFVTRHDLSKLEVDVLLGGTAFFSNGDILLRRGPDTRTLYDTLRAFQRRKNEKSTQPDAADTGLYRCKLDTQQCVVFGSPPIDFKSTFSVFIDRQTDDVYISDSSRHLVRKYTSDGRQAADPVDGFKFPNQLLIHEDQLLIADTNHHRVRAVQTETEDFGAELASHNVVPTEARTNRQSWPSHFVKVGDEWWVNNMKTGMNYGGIYVFDDEWRYQREIKLPGDADPISLIAFNDNVLISDWYGDRVHRISTAGEVLGDFESVGLSEILAESTVERRKYRMLAWITVAIAIAMIVILVLKGTDWAPRRPTPGDDLPPNRRDEPVLLSPDPKNVKKIRTGMRLLRVATGRLVVQGG